METTTIAVTTQVKDKIKEFGTKGETYSEILQRLLESAYQRQLHDLLFDRKGTVTAEEAIDRAQKRWHK